MKISRDMSKGDLFRAVETLKAELEDREETIEIAGRENERLRRSLQASDLRANQMSKTAHETRLLLWKMGEIFLSRRHRFASWLGRIFGWDEPMRTFLTQLVDAQARYQASRKKEKEEELRAEESVQPVHRASEEVRDGVEGVGARHPGLVEDPGNVRAGDAGTTSDVPSAGDAVADAAPKAG